MQTIAELPEFIRAAEKLLTKAERNELAGLVVLLVQIWKEKKA